MQQKLTHVQRAAYGIGDLGINIYFQMSLFFLLFFYTDVLHISASVAAIILFCGRALDACVDPMLGALMDRTRSRWGKFRPWIMFGAVPMAALSVATFSSPGLSGNELIIFALVLHIAWSIAFSIIAIPYISLTAMLTRSSTERTMLSSYRMMSAYAAKLLVSGAVVYLVAIFPNPESGFQGTMLGLSIVATACLWITAGFCRERPLPSHQDSVGFGAGLIALFRNGPFWIVVAVFALNMLALTSRSAATIYYFNYVISAPELIGTFAIVMTGGMIVGTLFVAPITKRFGKKWTNVGSLCAQAVCFVILIMVPASDPNSVLIMAAPIGVFTGVSAVLGWAMIADTVEYGAWRTGVAAEGATYAVTKFVYQMAGALGGGAAGVTLGWLGYVAGEVQSSEVKSGVLFLFAGIPVIASLLAAGVLAFYRLTEAQHAEIVQDLESRA